jgi:hypothetical protein
MAMGWICASGVPGISVWFKSLLYQLSERGLSVQMALHVHVD